jgi:hypothetical protein
MWSWIGFVALVAAVLRLAVIYQRKSVQRKIDTDLLFADAVPLIDNPIFEAQGPRQYPRLSGTFKGFPVQLHPVVDTLATRRLPALWLLVTLQDRLPLAAKFDMMMRPSGATTFSNFDHLPHALKTPSGFPEQAVIRTDDAAAVIPSDIVKPHIGLFFGPRAKELLITENGLRVVWLMAEGDRARYGVFRQADFGQIQIDAATVAEILSTLMALRADILKWSQAK